MGADLRRRHVSVPEQLLHGADVVRGQITFSLYRASDKRSTQPGKGALTPVSDPGLRLAQGTAHPAPAAVEHMGVDLRRRHVSVPE
jgi:hypothetical protein